MRTVGEWLAIIVGGACLIALSILPLYMLVKLTVMFVHWTWSHTW
jgi:hypothetical protein